MTVVYAVVLGLGVIGVIGWVGATAVGDTVAGRAGADPDRRFGVRGRFAVAGAVGFGLAGMSATFAGWHPGLALLAALGGAAAVVAVALRYGPPAGEPDA